MKAAVKSVLNAALKLSERDRFALATRLLDSVTPDIGLFHVGDPLLIEELDRRCADSDLGIPWRDLRSEPSS